MMEDNTQKSISRAEKLQEFKASFESLVSEARGELVIYCPLLSGQLLNLHGIQSLKSYLIGQNGLRVLVLIDEKQPDLAEISALIGLARRLPSKLSLRCVNDDTLKFDKFTVLARTTLLTAAVDDKDGEPTKVTVTRVSPNKEQTERAKFFQIWDHQTWNNPYLREVSL